MEALPQSDNDRRGLRVDLRHEGNLFTALFDISLTNIDQVILVEKNCEVPLMANPLIKIMNHQSLRPTSKFAVSFHKKNRWKDRNLGVV